MPFNSAEFEEDAIAKKKAKDEMNQKPAAVSNTNEVLTQVISPGVFIEIVGKLAFEVTVTFEVSEQPFAVLVTVRT